MTQDEQKQFDQLQSQLTDANRNVERIRGFFASALDKSNSEARLYRNLFWSLFLLSLVAMIVRLLQK